MATVEDTRSEVRAEARYVRTAPRKAQLVAEQIRGRSVPEARTILAFMTRDAARDVERVLSSAVANAEQNHGLDGDELYVSHAIVGAGPTLKRWRARARGRVARIKKRTCHITISLALPEGGVIPAPIAQPVPPPPVEEAPEEEPKPERSPRKKAEPKAETATEGEPKAETATEDEPKAKAKPKPRRPAAKKSSGSTSKTSSRKKDEEA